MQHFVKENKSNQAHPLKSDQVQAVEHDVTVERTIWQSKFVYFLSKRTKKNEKKNRQRHAVTVDSILICGSVRALMNRGTCLDTSQNHVCMNVCTARVCDAYVLVNIGASLLQQKECPFLFFLFCQIFFVTSICQRLKWSWGWPFSIIVVCLWTELKKRKKRE